MYIHTKVVYNIHEFIMLLKIKYIWNWLHVKRCEGWLICKSFILFSFRSTGFSCWKGTQDKRAGPESKTFPFFFFLRVSSHVHWCRRKKYQLYRKKKKKIPQVHRSDLIHLPPALKSNVITFYESYNKIDFPYPHWGNSWSLTS